MQQNDVQRNDVQQNDVRRNDLQRNNMQRNDVQRNDVQRNDVRRNDLRPIDLADTYLHLARGAGLRVLDVDEDFWATIDQRTDLDDGRLVMATPVAGDWTNWEMHPEGDEVILVTDGVVRVHTDPGDPVVVRAPDLVIMPAGTWHTMDVVEPARVVTITWGAGTQHRDR